MKAYKRSRRNCFLISIFFVFVFIWLMKDSDPIENVKKQLTSDNFLLITVRTTFKNHTTKLGQIIDTWYRLAPDNIYFVTDVFDPVLNKAVKGHLIKTNCGSKDELESLGCKLRHELEFMKEKNAMWSCHFDDDTYVNIPALKEQLKKVEHVLPYFLGKTLTKMPSTIHGNVFWHAATSNGICFTAPALQKLTPELLKDKFYLDYVQHDKISGDEALAYIMQTLGVVLTEHEMFNFIHATHLPLKALKSKTIFKFRKQNSVFGALPYFFEPEDDPFKFQTLHCFLYPKQCNSKLGRLNIRIFRDSIKNSHDDESDM